MPGQDEVLQISEERIARVVSRVLEQREIAKQDKDVIRKLRDYVTNQQKKERERGDAEKSYITKEKLDSIIKKKEESEKGTFRVKALPELLKGERDGLTPKDEERRDDGVSTISTLLHMTDKDMERHIQKDGRNNLKQYGLRQAGRADFERCYIGEDGQIHCDKLRKEGLRIQVQDTETKKWRTLGVSEEEQKKEQERTISHF